MSIHWWLETQLKRPLQGVAPRRPSYWITHSHPLPKCFGVFSSLCLLGDRISLFKTRKDFHHCSIDLKKISRFCYIVPEKYRARTPTIYICSCSGQEDGMLSRTIVVGWHWARRAVGVGATFKFVKHNGVTLINRQIPEMTFWVSSLTPYSRLCPLFGLCWKGLIGSFVGPSASAGRINGPFGQVTASIRRRESTSETRSSC